MRHLSPSPAAGAPQVTGLRSILALAALLGALLLVYSPQVASQVYKYRDVNGNLVYSEEKPDAKTNTEAIAVNLEPKAPRIEVDQSINAGHWQFKATNECLCVAQFEVRVLEAQHLAVGVGAVYRATLQANSQQLLAQLDPLADGEPAIKYSWKAILGVPGAQHAPHEPYRAPFAVGASYRITQAYPTRFTHGSPDSQFAVDIALPDGTPVYAAREGTVINLRHDSFRGAASSVMLDQANMIEILHDDGTIAVYAHLHWDSVRVQPGQHVRRGEYIADSGNTGFTTGPHLHFAVIRNAGLQSVSVPIEFSGPAETPVTPQQNAMLTAY